MRCLQAVKNSQGDYPRLYVMPRQHVQGSIVRTRHRTGSSDADMIQVAVGHQRPTERSRGPLERGGRLLSKLERKGFNLDEHENDTGKQAGVYACSQITK